jgi:hypothetical protein
VSGLQASVSTRSSSERIRYAEPKRHCTKIDTTVRYVGIKIDDAIEIAEKIDV